MLSFLSRDGQKASTASIGCPTLHTQGSFRTQCLPHRPSQHEACQSLFSFFLNGCFRLRTSCLRTSCPRMRHCCSSFRRTSYRKGQGPEPGRVPGRGQGPAWGLAWGLAWGRAGEERWAGGATTGRRFHMIPRMHHSNHRRIHTQGSQCTVEYLR